jgi:16S rRNA (cytosine967-C5)-methyltransferase
MTPDFKNLEITNLRELALYLLVYSQNGDKKLSDQLESFQKRINLADQRNLYYISDIFYGVYKRQITLDAILEFLIKKDFKKLPPVILNILRIGLFQLYYMETVPDSAAINESVKLAKKYGHQGTVKLTNAVLRNAVRKKAEIENQIDSLETRKQQSIRFSIPLWLIDYWTDSYPAIVNGLAESFLQEAPLFLRINTLKVSPDLFKKTLKEQNISFKETAVSEGIEITEKISLKNLSGYQEGYWYIQDPGAMLVSKVLDPQKDSFIIDFCAFPGGKTTHISQLMENTGEILVIDSNKKRQERFLENTGKLGNKNIRTLIQSATQPLDSDKKADKILVDPPCSGFGVIRRKVEIKYRKSLEDLKRLALLQSEILQNASGYLKVGGEMVYSTCTLSPVENEAVINRFLGENNNFRLKKFPLFGQEQELINLFPNIHGTDGFFIAKLERMF